jgi:prevent-host-death family protein
VKTVGIFEAKTHLSALVEEVARGETVVVTKNGLPVAKIVPVEQSTPRNFGKGDARVVISDDFDELPAELLRAFYGK